MMKRTKKKNPMKAKAGIKTEEVAMMSQGVVNAIRFLSGTKPGRALLGCLMLWGHELDRHVEEVRGGKKLKEEMRKCGWVDLSGPMWKNERFRNFRKVRISNEARKEIAREILFRYEETYPKEIVNAAFSWA